jgi:hypothetical protein
MGEGGTEVSIASQFSFLRDCLSMQTQLKKRPLESLPIYLALYRPSIQFSNSNICTTEYNLQNTAFHYRIDIPSNF